MHKERKRNDLFNDALNTFYLRLYSIRHMGKYNTDSERGNPLLPHGLLFPINSKCSFICTISQTRLHIPRPLLQQSYSTGWNEITVHNVFCVHLFHQWMIMRSNSSRLLQVEIIVEQLRCTPLPLGHVHQRERQTDDLLMETRVFPICLQLECILAKEHPDLWQM